VKRTCNGCKALDWHTGYWGCRLGYKMDIEKRIPKEECPKPMTFKVFLKTPSKIVNIKEV
jgi:hypothetical protein